MSIPNEAIEAAAKAIHKEFTTSDRPDGKGGWTPDTVYGGPEEVAHVVLAAATPPHLLSEAWGDGYLAGLADMQSGQERPNPYRSQS